MNHKVSNRNINDVNISETLLVSKILLSWPGQIRLSRYTLTTESKTSLSLNKKPVYITNRLTHASAVFF